MYQITPLSWLMNCYLLHLITTKSNQAPSLTSVTDCIQGGGSSALRYVPDIVIVLWFVVHEICVSCYISKTSSCSALFRRVYVPMTGIFGVALVTATLFALRSSTTSVCVGVASRLPGNCASEETSTPTALSCSAVSSSLSSVICNTALPFEHLPRNWSSLSAPSSALQSGVCSRLSS